MTAHLTSNSIELRVMPASSSADWTEARRLVAQLVNWLSCTVGVDARREQHDSDFELDTLEHFYGEPNGRMLLGLVDGWPQGTTGVHLMSPRTAELRRVWVAPGARGCGLASLLLHAGIETARDLGATSLCLETVRGHMDTAIGMYARAGFRPIRPYSSLGATLPNALSLGLALTPAGCQGSTRDRPAM
jgi:GNAT superfamily N-acetyltransferase